MLFLSTDSGQRPGDTVALTANGGQVTLRVEAVADQPLTRVEIVVNGQVVSALPIEDAHHVVGS